MKIRSKHLARAITGLHILIFSSTSSAFDFKGITDGINNAFDHVNESLGDLAESLEPNQNQNTQEQDKPKVNAKNTSSGGKAAGASDGFNVDGVALGDGMDAVLAAWGFTHKDIKTQRAPYQLGVNSRDVAANKQAEFEAEVSKRWPTMKKLCMGFYNMCHPLVKDGIKYYAIFDYNSELIYMQVKKEFKINSDPDAAISKTRQKVIAKYGAPTKYNPSKTTLHYSGMLVGISVYGNSQLNVNYNSTPFYDANIQKKYDAEIKDTVLQIEKDLRKKYVLADEIQI